MATFDDLIQRYSPVTYKKGETIILRGEQISFVYVIIKGYVKLYAISDDGAERQIALLGPSEHMPVGWSLGLNDTTEHYHEAYSNVTLKKIPREIVLETLKNDREALYKVYIAHEKRLNAMMARINALEHPRANDKVAFMLLELANEIGTKLRPFKDRMELRMTQQEIADAIGLSRETTGSELKKLEFKHIITHSRKKYVLYIERLKSYLEDR